MTSLIRGSQWGRHKTYLKSVDSHMSVYRMIRDMLQAAGFAGNILSLLIVRCIFRIGSPLKLTFLNQMFLIYYAIDAIVGSTEIHFLFKLKEER